MDGALGRAQRLKSVLDRGAGTVHTDVTAPYTGVQNAGRAIEENIDAVKAIYAKWSQYPPYESNSQGPTFARVFPEVEAALNRIKNGEPPITSFSPRNNFEARQPWRGAVLDFNSYQTAFNQLWHNPDRRGVAPIQDSRNLGADVLANFSQQATNVAEHANFAKASNPALPIVVERRIADDLGKLRSAMEGLSKLKAGPFAARILPGIENIGERLAALTPGRRATIAIVLGAAGIAAYRPGAMDPGRPARKRPNGEGDSSIPVLRAGRHTGNGELES